MSAPITVEILRHDLSKAQIIADVFIDGERVLEATNLVAEGIEYFDPAASGDGDLRARASSAAKPTAAWRRRETARVSPTLSFGLGGEL